MTALLILLIGLIGLFLDPQIPQPLKTVIWCLLLVFGIVLGALSNFKV